MKTNQKSQYFKKTELNQRSNVTYANGKLFKILVNQIQYSIENIKLWQIAFTFYFTLP